MLAGMSRRGLVLLGAFALIAVGVVGERLATTPSAAPPAPPAAVAPPPADASLEARVTAFEAEARRLAGELERVHEQREELAFEVAALRDELAGLQRQRATRTARRGGAQAAAARKADAKSPAQPQGPRPLDVGALVAAGFPEQTVRAFKETMDQRELDQLYLRDLAAREGWLGTPRFAEAQQALAAEAASTREEYGDEFYDWMLYTTGHPNRVQVNEVIAGSVADGAGLRAGDVILRYGDERVFQPTELRDATSSGAAGDSVTLDVLRDGRPTRIVVPRGPLGVRVEGVPIEPARAG